MKVTALLTALLVLAGCMTALAETKVAVIYNAAYANEYKNDQTALLSSLGWTQDLYDTTQLKTLAPKLRNYNVVIFNTLFNYANIQKLADFGQDFRDFISSGGCLIVPDACYTPQTDWLRSIDPGLIWRSSGYLSGDEKKTATRINSTHPLMQGVDAPVLAWTAPDYYGLGMTHLVDYTSGKPAAAVMEIGKGCIVVSTLTHFHGWPSGKFLENMMKWIKDPDRLAKVKSRDDEIAKRGKQRPTLNVPQMPNPPSIDGNISTSEWDSAKLIPELYDMSAGYAYSQKTKCHVGRYKNDLYIMFECSDTDIPGIVKGLTAHDCDYWQNDSVEFFIDPTNERQGYYHFGVGCSGGMYDARMTETEWDGNWQAKTSIGTDGWIAEIKVPFSTFGEDIVKSNGTWAVNFCRTARPGSDLTRENTNWAPTFGYFHKPEKFGTITNMKIDKTELVCSPLIETKLPKEWFIGSNRVAATIKGYSKKTTDAVLSVVDIKTGKTIQTINTAIGNKAKQAFDLDVNLDSERQYSLQIVAKETAGQVLASSPVIKITPVPLIDVNVLFPVFRTNIQSKDPVKKFVAECTAGVQSKENVKFNFSVKDQNGSAVYETQKMVYPRKKFRIEKDLDKLAYGKYQLVFEVFDNNTLMATKSLPLNVLAPAKTEVTFDENKTCYLNGKPFFPIGLYHVSPAAMLAINPASRSAGVPEFDLYDVMEQVKKHGFNVVHHTWGMPTEEYLQKAEELGLWVLPEVGAPSAEQVVLANKYSSVLMWYGSDEPSGERLNWIREALARTSELDPHRPVSAAVCSDNLFKPALQGFDFVMMDPYFIRYRPLSGIADWIRKGDAASNGIKPVWMVPQAFTIGNSPWSEPTCEELRCEAYISIVHGVKGFVWYAFWSSEPWKENPKGRNQWVLPDSKLWDYFTILNAQINDMSPVYLTGKSEGPVKCTSKSIHTNRWIYKGKTYIMAVNPSNKPVKCAVGGFGSRDAEVIYESRSIKPADGKISENFKPLEVHIYKY